MNNTAQRRTPAYTSKFHRLTLRASGRRRNSVRAGAGHWASLGRDKPFAVCQYTPLKSDGVRWIPLDSTGVHCGTTGAGLCHRQTPAATGGCWRILADVDLASTRHSTRARRPTVLCHGRASMTKSPASISTHAAQMSVPADTADITPSRSTRCAIRGGGRAEEGAEVSVRERPKKREVKGTHVVTNVTARSCFSARAPPVRTPDPTPPLAP